MFILEPFTLRFVRAEKYGERVKQEIQQWMYCINVKEQGVFHDKGTHVQSTGIAVFLRPRVLAMFSFSAINVYSTIEIGLHSLYRKKVDTSFKLNENIIRSQYSFPRKKKKNRFVSRKPSR